jgi:hypothetical protein
MGDSEILATVSPSVMRRMSGLTVLITLGGLLLYMGASAASASPLWRIFLISFGVFILWAADRMRRATLSGVVLTVDGLFDTDGNLLAAMDDIVSVERGSFALKPSNGFSVRTVSRQAFGWAPGLWWRYGRRVGVGGVTAAPQAKFMAELLATRLPPRPGALV